MQWKHENEFLIFIANIQWEQQWMHIVATLSYYITSCVEENCIFAIAFVSFSPTSTDQITDINDIAALVLCFACKWYARLNVLQW